jgi:hypothetical protein
MALTTFALLPQIQQLPKLMLPADEPGQGARALGVETATDNSLAENALGRYRLCEPLKRVRPGTFIDEYVAEEPARALRNQHSIWVGCCLESGRQVRSDADRRLFLCRSFALHFTDDNQAGRNAYSHLQRLTGRQKKLADLCHQLESRARSPLCVIFMGVRISKIGQDPVTHESGNMTARIFERAGANCLKPADNLCQIFGVELTRERSRAHEITKHYRKMASLSFRVSRAQGFDIDGGAAAAAQIQAGATIAAEFLSAWALAATGGTEERQCSTALCAKPFATRIDGAAAWTTHSNSSEHRSR